MDAEDMVHVADAKTLTTENVLRLDVIANRDPLVHRRNHLSFPVQLRIHLLCVARGNPERETRLIRGAD